MTVPAGVLFGESASTVTFTATVVSVTSGSAKIIASNAASGAWAEYNVHPIVPDLGIDGPWLVSGLGAVQYTLTRTGAVGDEIALTSTNAGVATVPATATFGVGESAITFFATGVAYGATTIIATDTVSGAWATYDVTFQLPTDLPIPDITFVPATGDFTFPEPVGYDLYKVYGANCVPNAAQGWDWVELELDTDYSVAGGVVTILTDAAARQIIRVSFIPE